MNYENIVKTNVKNDNKVDYDLVTEQLKLFNSITMSKMYIAQLIGHVNRLQGIITISGELSDFKDELLERQEKLCQELEKYDIKVDNYNEFVATNFNKLNNATLIKENGKSILESYPVNKPF